MSLWQLLTSRTARRQRWVVRTAAHLRRYPSLYRLLGEELGITAVTARYLKDYRLDLPLNSGGIMAEVLRDGVFEGRLLELIAEGRTSELGAFINIGANIGTSCLNGHALGFREFHAFEPVSANHRRLARNLTQLEADSRVHLYRLAVGSAAGEAVISLNEKSIGQHSIVQSFGGPEETVQVVRIDDQHHLPVGFLWIDTEGFEAEVLRGAREYLRTKATGVCIEFSPRLLSAEDYYESVGALLNGFQQCFLADGQPFTDAMATSLFENSMQFDLVCLEPAVR